MPRFEGRTDDRPTWIRAGNPPSRHCPLGPTDRQTGGGVRLKDCNLSRHRCVRQLQDIVVVFARIGPDCVSMRTYQPQQPYEERMRKINGGRPSPMPISESTTPCFASYFWASSSCIYSGMASHSG